MIDVSIETTYVNTSMLIFNRILHRLTARWNLMYIRQVTAPVFYSINIEYVQAPSYVMLCYVMLCYVMLCYVMLCDVL